MNRWMRINYRGWQYDDKFRLHQELGDNFMIVSPGTNVLFVGCPDAVQEIFVRRREFVKAIQLYSELKA